MTGSDHARYEELVAGHALDALEPEDEQELLAHLRTCAACERDLAQHRETLARLASVADAGPPPSALWESVRRAVLEQSGGTSFEPPAPRAAEAPAGLPSQTPQPREAPGAGAGAGHSARLRGVRARQRDHQRRGLAWAALGLAVVLVGGLTGGLVHEHSARQAESARADRLAAAVRAVQTGSARTVSLKSGGGEVAALAVVSADHLSLVVGDLPVNDPETSVYVLWSGTATGRVTAVATFDVKEGGVDVLRDVTLPTGSPTLLAITKEPGRTAPARTAQKPVAAAQI